MINTIDACIFIKATLDAGLLDLCFFLSFFLQVLVELKSSQAPTIEFIGARFIWRKQAWAKYETYDR